MFKVKKYQCHYCKLFFKKSDLKVIDKGMYCTNEVFICSECFIKYFAFNSKAFSK
jgi:hypothetical protein